jgi:hypothetical protein
LALFDLCVFKPPSVFRLSRLMKWRTGSRRYD